MKEGRSLCFFIIILSRKTLKCFIYADGKKILNGLDFYYFLFFFTHCLYFGIYSSLYVVSSLFFLSLQVSFWYICHDIGLETA